MGGYYLLREATARENRDPLKRRLLTLILMLDKDAAACCIMGDVNCEISIERKV